MGIEDVQAKLNKLWGAKIKQIQFSLIKDYIYLELEMLDFGNKSGCIIEFLDVSAMYYVNDEEESRYDFYDRESVEYLELTSFSILKENKELGNIKFNLPLEKEWSKNYNSKINIVIEIWNSVLCIEARKIVINREVFSLE